MDRRKPALERYSTYSLIVKHLDEREVPVQAESTRIVSIQE